MPPGRASGAQNASVSTVFGTTTMGAFGATARRVPSSSWLTGATTSACSNANRASRRSPPVIRPRPKPV